MIYLLAGLVRNGPAKWLKSRRIQKPRGKVSIRQRTHDHNAVGRLDVQQQQQ